MRANMQRKPDSVEWILGGIIVVAVLFVWFSSKSNKNSVAIIRMDDIAKETGWDVQIGDVVRKKRAADEKDIMRQQQLLKADIDTKRESIWRKYNTRTIGNFTGHAAADAGTNDAAKKAKSRRAAKDANATDAGVYELNSNRLS